MGFNEVYKVLREIFPEVDARALRAVAIEHHKDSDLAAEVVLTEVIPFLAERSTVSSSSSESRIQLRSPEVEVSQNGNSSEHDLVEDVQCPDEKQHGPFYDASDEHNQTLDDTNGINLDSRPEKVTPVSKYDERSVTNGVDISSSISSAILMHENEANPDDVKISGDCASEETQIQSSQENCILVGYDQVSQLDMRPLDHQNLGFLQNLDSYLHTDSNDSKYYEKNTPVGDSVGLISESNLGPLTVTSSESIVQLVDMSDTQSTSLEKELNGPKDAATNTESFSEMIDVGHKPMLNTVVTRSGQVFSIDLLEGIIADARNNKKNLLSALETVISLMKEVELQEKAAEQAKQDAANGGLEILKRVEDLKEMLQHAKEANDMHAGEVYGEKAILAAEIRELQSRLLCLSDERDKSLGVLHEMRQNLEIRLAAAEKERKMAEQEKLEKEDIAWKALKNQEIVVEKVVQEANILRQEAEENAKLREFLIDRGRVVDTLQGEISVICMDVRLLKEKFDERLPLSKSLTSSQTSCLVASSSSSSKSRTSEQVDGVTDHDPLETPEESERVPLFYEPEFIQEQVVGVTDRDPLDTLEESELVAPFYEPEFIQEQVDGVADHPWETLKESELVPLSYEPEFIREETAADDHKELTDEGWEIC